MLIMETKQVKRHGEKVRSEIFTREARCQTNPWRLPSGRVTDQQNNLW